MLSKEVAGINSFLIEMSNILLDEGVRRETRGNVCYEIPNPINIKILNPTARIVTIPQRQWNYALPFAESLWLASGRNDLSLVEKYLPKLKNYSDDGKTMRAGYGPRLRHYNGISNDYNIGAFRKKSLNTDSALIEVDQFDFVLKSFEKDPYTRQAIITISDPPKDCFTKEQDLKQTRDFPCTKSLHFQRTHQDKLDLVVHMRSNDFLWGASAVNIFNYTFIQEYFAMILGLEIGSYYHMVDNLHYYEDMRQMVISMKDLPIPKDEPFTYERSFSTLREFDSKLEILSAYEEDIRLGRRKDLIELEDDFFNDWAKVFYARNHSVSGDFNFKNPSLQYLIEQMRYKKRSALLKEAISRNTNNKIANSKK